MKKTLLFLTIVAFSFASFAQQIDRNSRNISVPVKKTTHTGMEVTAEPDQNYSPVRLVNRNFIGATLYDCQTNGTMASRIIAREDGTVSTVWTTQSGNTNSRGTGYNYYSNGNWDFGQPSARIENERTGWCAITAVNNYDVIVAHNAVDGLVISIAEKGTDEWTFSKLMGPAVVNGTTTKTTLNWPAIASNGNTIHLLACSESDEGFLYNGINCCLLYYRGTFNESTKTITWDAPKIVGDVTSEQVERFAGDDYAIAVKDNVVAIVAKPAAYANDAFLWKSTDNGDNFTYTMFSEGYKVNGDTSYIDDGNFGLAIDEQGMAHVAFGAYLGYTKATGDSSYWYPGTGEIIYWNESLPAITRNTTNDQTYKNPEVLRELGYTVFDPVEQTCDDGFSGVSWGVDAYPSYGCASVSMPQLVAQGGKIYLVFTSVLEFPFLDVTNTRYYRGIFACKSDDNGANFGDISWLSYSKDCLYMNSWEMFPMPDSITLGELTPYIEYISENVYPSVAKNIVNGNIKMTWQNDINAGSYVKEEDPVDESYIYYFEMTADSIGIYNNTKEVCQGIWQDHTGIANRVISGMKLYPNPASNSVNVAFTSEETSNAVLTVMNMMGQTVLSETHSVNEGHNLINLGLNNVKSGVYMINIKTNKGTSTQKLIVK